MYEVRSEINKLTDISIILCFILGRVNSSQNYVWIYEYRTWTGAQSYCREKYTDLASVRNETERQQILNVTLYRNYGWIGLYRNRLWSDQSNSSFTYWLPWTQGVAAQPDNGVTLSSVCFLLDMMNIILTHEFRQVWYVLMSSLLLFSF
uniref:C-type lectin domain-containing protein n=1 Tax=Cyprinus carpio TaxID=7962 RepID=A0A8C1MU96_CYPCA